MCVLRHSYEFPTINTTELLIVVWGVCFVMKRQERGPALKGRTFKIPRKKKGKTRTRSTATPAEGEEQRPHWEAGDEAGDSRNDSATTTLPVGASGLGANQKEGDSMGAASLPAGPENELPRRDIAASTGTSNSRRGTDAPTAAFGRGFFRPAFSQHRKKSSGSLDSTVSAQKCSRLLGDKGSGVRLCTFLPQPCYHV